MNVCEEGHALKADGNFCTLCGKPRAGESKSVLADKEAHANEQDYTAAVNVMGLVVKSFESHLQEIIQKIKIICDSLNRAFRTINSVSSVNNSAGVVDQKQLFESLLQDVVGLLHVAAPVDNPGHLQAGVGSLETYLANLEARVNDSLQDPAHGHAIDETIQAAKLAFHAFKGEIARYADVCQFDRAAQCAHVAKRIEEEISQIEQARKDADSAAQRFHYNEVKAILEERCRARLPPLLLLFNLEAQPAMAPVPAQAKQENRAAEEARLCQEHHRLQAEASAKEEAKAKSRAEAVERVKAELDAKAIAEAEANAKPNAEADAAIPSVRIGDLRRQALRLGAIEDEVDKIIEQDHKREGLISLIKSKLDPHQRHGCPAPAPIESPPMAAAQSTVPDEQEPTYKAVARQADGHEQVVLKNDTGDVVAKVVNGDMVRLLRTGDVDALVRWSDRIDGWAKKSNLQVDITVYREPERVMFGVSAKLSDNLDDIRAKVAEHESIAVHRIQLYHREQLLGIGTKPGWNIKHRDLIKMSVTERPPPPVIHNDIRCFVSGQITEEVGKRVGALQPQTLKASMPNFNKPKHGLPYPQGMECIDIPCYGPALTEAIIALFDLDLVKQTARELRFMIPGCSINEVITKKNMERGPQLIEAIKVAGGDSASVQKLEKFVQKIQELKAEDFVAHGKPRSDGKSWVDEYCAPGWRDKLHVNIVLTNFGFTDAFCQSFKGKLVHAGGKETWTDYAVRWLSKVFDVFSFQGSPSDVVNMIYATLGKPYSPKPSIEQVVETVKEFTNILRCQQWNQIVWKPNYLIQDSELDDMLAWLLCLTICLNTNSTLVCAVQLPPETPANGPPTQIDFLQSQYESRSTSQNSMIIFRDPQSRNQDKVEYSSCCIPPKTVYLVSETEMRSFVGEYTWNGEINMFKRGCSRLYLHPVSGCWCVSLDVAGMAHDYFQIRARTKGCLPHNNLGWSMLVRPENNGRNILAPRPLIWNSPNSNRPAIWLDLDPHGAPVLPHGQIYDGPKPVFHFSISRKPLQRAESPPRCLDPACAFGREAEHDGLTRCVAHTWKSKKQNPECPMYKRARAFINELGVTGWLDHRWDHCFCSTCHPATLNAIIPGKQKEGQLSDSFQITPRGWVAFGIVVPRHLSNGANFEDIWTWPSSFHGTRATLLPHILRQGQIGMPGDRLIGDLDGGVLLAKHCAGRQEAGKFYTSPTIDYAGLQFYAKPRRSTSMPGVVGQVVLQCNQNREPANLVAEQGETMGFRKNNFPQHGVCKYTPLYLNPHCSCVDCGRIPAQNHAIEVVSSRPELCVIRRVLIRTFNESQPPTRSAWQGNKKLTPSLGHRETFRSPVDCPPGTIDGDAIWL